MGIISQTLYLLQTESTCITMKLTTILAAFAALACSAVALPQGGADVTVVRDDSVAPVGAVYKTDFELSNGIAVQEEGSEGSEGQTNVVGSYSFTAEDGTVYPVTFTADENGFRATGDHLPS